MDLVVVEEFGSIVQAIADKLNINLVYIPDTDSGIRRKLEEVITDTPPGETYTLIALVAPVPETPEEGRIIGNFPRILIATKTDSELSFLERYPVTFKPILYPIWKALKCEIETRNGNSLTNINYPDFSKADIPGDIPPGQQIKDYLDAIELTNLKIKFTDPDQVTCAKPWRKSLANHIN